MKVATVMVNRFGPARFQWHRAAARRGQVLLEFAFIAVILIFLLGGALSLGYFFYSAHSLQQAADVAAQEIARMPFDPFIPLGLGDLNAPLDAAMFDPRFLDQIYDERHLVIRRSLLEPYGGSFADYVNTLPLLNRLLASVMIFDPAYDPEGNGGVYRYPGTIVVNHDTGHETVLIPLVEYDESGTGEIYRWLAPVEEMRVPAIDANEPPLGPFSLAPVANIPAGFVPGMVALRINYPAQAAGLIGRNPTTGSPIRADDSSLSDQLPTTRYELALGPDIFPSFDGSSRIHAGQFGLGQQASLWQAVGVRPYRKVLSAQAVYRREVFE